MSCYRTERDAIVLHVRLTPKAARDAIDGVKVLADGKPVALARVRAVPDKGEANKALLLLLSHTFGVPKAAVSLVSGATARQKQVRIAGNPPDLGGVVEAWPRSA
jgi:uncharacterized protein (TIGR00251 family)